MKIIKTRKIFSVFIFIFGLIVILAYKSGAPAGNTCAPMETNCATNGLCHSSSVNTGSATFDISMMGGVPSTGYVPGATYTLMPWIVDNAKTLFGFQMRSRKGDGSNAGSVTIISPVKTKLVQGNGIDYVEQTSSGAMVNGIHDWMYDWTAPPAGSGRLVFYAAFVAANGNAASSGDDVYIDSLVIQESTIGIDENKALESNISLYPNPSNNSIHIHFNKVLYKDFQLRIFDMRGKLVLNDAFSAISTANDCKINISNLMEGIYFMQILSDKTVFSMKRFSKIQ